MPLMICPHPVFWSLKFSGDDVEVIENLGGMLSGRNCWSAYIVTREFYIFHIRLPDRDNARRSLQMWLWWKWISTQKFQAWQKAFVYDARFHSISWSPWVLVDSTKRPIEHTARVSVHNLRWFYTARKRAQCASGQSKYTQRVVSKAFAATQSFLRRVAAGLSNSPGSSEQTHASQFLQHVVQSKAQLYLFLHARSCIGSIGGDLHVHDIVLLPQSYFHVFDAQEGYPKGPNSRVKSHPPSLLFRDQWHFGISLTFGKHPRHGLATPLFMLLAIVCQLPDDWQ